MVDFAKLRDPVVQAEIRAKIAAEQAALESHEKKLRGAVDLGLQLDESLTEAERSLVRNCRTRLLTYQSVSEKQEKWLLDIASRLRKEQANRFAAGDDNGEHPTYTRDKWPHATEFESNNSAYWAWVLHQIVVHGGDEAHCSNCGRTLDGDSRDGKCGACTDRFGDADMI